MSNATDDLVVVAHLVKTRGLRGELIARQLTDFPERFEGLRTVIGVGAGENRSLQIEEHWFHGDRLVLKFVGFDSIETAQTLVGLQIAVPGEQRIKLPTGQFYEWELTGCEVLDLAGKTIGRVQEVMRTGGVELLVVTNDTAKDMLIPMAEDICVEIDVDRKLIRIDPPEGLLEL